MHNSSVECLHLQCACLCLAACILHLKVLWDSPLSPVICWGSAGAGSPGRVLTEMNGVNVCRVFSCRSCPCPHPTLKSRQGWQEGSHPYCASPPCGTTLLLIVASVTHISDDSSVIHPPLHADCVSLRWSQSTFSLHQTVH